MTEKARRTRSWEYQRQTVLRQWREHGNDLFELECGHTEVKNGLARPDLLREIACEDCPPVQRSTFTKPDAWTDDL